MGDLPSPVVPGAPEPDPSAGAPGAAPFLVGHLSDSGLQTLIDHALDGVEASHGHATVTFQREGVYVVLAERLSDHWSVKAVGKVEYDGSHPEFEAVLQGSW